MTVTYPLLTSSPSPSWVHSLCLGLVVLIVIVVLLALVDRWVSVQQGLREGFFSERIKEIPIQLVPSDVMFITEEQKNALMKTVHTMSSSSSVMVTKQMTLTKLKTVCQTEEFQGCVGIGLNHTTFEEVVFFKDREKMRRFLEEVSHMTHSSTSAPSPAPTHTNPPVTLAVHAYLAIPLGDTLPGGVGISSHNQTPFNKAAQQYFNGPRINRKTIRRTLGIGCPPENNPCSSPGRKSCFLVDSSSSTTSSTASNTQPASTTSSTSSTTSSTTPSLFECAKRLTDPTVLTNSKGSTHLKSYHTDATLFYIDAREDVYVRQNHLRCAPLYVAQKRAKTEGGIPLTYNSNELGEAPCSYEVNRCHPGSTLLSSDCVVGNPPISNPIFRKDLQMMVSTANQCNYPSQVTITPSATCGEFQTAYEKECANKNKMSTMDLCAFTYKDEELQRPFYQYVCPYASVEMLYNAERLKARIAAGTPVHLLLDTTSQYVTTTVSDDTTKSSSSTSSQHPGKILSIQTEDPYHIRVEYVPLAQEGAGAESSSSTGRSSEVMVSKILWNGTVDTATRGEMRLRNPTTMKESDYMFVIGEKGQAVVRLSNTHTPTPSSASS